MSGDVRFAISMQGRMILLAGGTGNPFFTTDTTAVLRAAEIGAGAVLKATDVDGVYSADPKRDKNAKRYERLSHQEAIERNLKVMDTTAFALARENHMPIIVFSIREQGSDHRRIARKRALHRRQRVMRVASCRRRSAARSQVDQPIRRGRQWPAQRTISMSSSAACRARSSC